MPPEKLDRVTDLRHAHFTGGIGKRLEGRIGMAADRQDGRSPTSPSYRLGNKNRKTSPACEEADHFTVKRLKGMRL
jgi:hypothetical protein